MVGEVRTSGTKIDVGSVLGAGRELELHEQFPLPEFASFTFAQPAEVALTIRRLGRGVELLGTIDAEARGACARCLDDVTLPLSIEVVERLEGEQERTGPLDESNILSGGELDVADLVRQLIDSALPIVALCAEDCPGLCPVCGAKRGVDCRCPATPLE